MDKQNRQRHIQEMLLLAAFLHFINQSKYYGLLFLTQSRPSLQKLSLWNRQRNGRIFFCKQLRKCDTKSCTDFFQGRNRRDHILAIPRGDCRLRQARAFCKLILRPAPILSICGYGRENIFHLHHPFICVLRKLYFCLSLPFNHFNRMILTIYTSTERMLTMSQKSCFLIGHRKSLRKNLSSTVCCHRGTYNPLRCHRIYGWSLRQFWQSCGKSCKNHKTKPSRSWTYLIVALPSGRTSYSCTRWVWQYLLSSGHGKVPARLLLSGQIGIWSIIPIFSLPMRGALPATQEIFWNMQGRGRERFHPGDGLATQWFLRKSNCFYIVFIFTNFV